MASIKAKGFNSPKFMPVDGCSTAIIDIVSLTTAPAANDTLDYFIPAGLEVFGVSIQCDDLDSNGTPTFAFQAGYTPVNPASSLSPALTYFAGAGQTTARTGGRLVCAFKPIKFEEDVILRLTVGTAAATFAAGDVITIVEGNTVGPK